VCVDSEWIRLGRFGQLRVVEVKVHVLGVDIECIGWTHVVE